MSRRSQQLGSDIYNGVFLAAGLVWLSVVELVSAFPLGASDMEAQPPSKIGCGRPTQLSPKKLNSLQWRDGFWEI